MMNTPSMYSVDQLLKARQNGVPDYVVVPMLQKAMAQKQAMAQQQALQQGMNPPPPVADQILDAAHNDVMQEHMARQVEEKPEPRGIDSLPSGIDEEDYAGGGIIAFNGEDGSDVPEARNSIAYPSAPEDMPMPHSKEEESAVYKAKELQDLLGEDPNAARREARLSKREADLAEEKDRSPWMALMQAGLSTMAGTSPNALSNIGAGATKGLESYGEARKDISKSSDKLMDLRDEVEAAQRAEQKAIKLKGFESAEAARAANIKTDAENKLRRYTHGKDAAEYGQKERELQATSSLRGAQAEEARAKAKYYGADGAGSRGTKGAMTANQQVNTLKYHDTKLSKEILALEKKDNLSDEEKQYEIDVRKDRQAQIADIMESIMVGNRIDPAEVLKLNEPFPAYKAPAVQKKSSVWEDIKNFASGPTPQPSKTVADNSKIDALLNKYR